MTDVFLLLIEASRGRGRRKGRGVARVLASAKVAALAAELISDAGQATYQRHTVLGWVRPGAGVFVALIEPRPGERNVMAVCAHERTANALCAAVTSRTEIPAHYEAHAVEACA